jgi:hypothetical protein
MENTFLVVTSIASDEHPILKKLANEASQNNIPFILIGDTKSPSKFSLEGCDFYSAEQQQNLDFELAKILPFKHYARKNLGYLLAISKGADVIIETDDDNIPFEDFWKKREINQHSYLLSETGWTNIYRYFTDINIWPRGFALDEIQKENPPLTELKDIRCPIQQGLADENPDVDALYRLVFPLPVSFNKNTNVAFGKNTVCPFNSQNTTWFKEAFPLMYLPSYCSFRMTDIWRSFIAQRIAWTCGWPILFHNSTVWQVRNDHNLMKDFSDEIIGYTNNNLIIKILSELNLKEGKENISSNLILCYQKLIDLGLVGKEELELLKAWVQIFN